MENKKKDEKKGEIEKKDEKKIFHFREDRFKGIKIDMNKKENQTENIFKNFEKLLKEFIVISKNQNQKFKSIWFKVPLKYSNLLVILGKEKFIFHHAKGENSNLVLWISDGENKIPEFSRARIGVGAFVCDFEEKKVLLVQENYTTIKDIFWKYPGGSLNPEELISEAMEREVMEEVGIKCEFHDILGFRYLQSFYGGQDDIYVICIAKALSKKLVRDEDEIKKCQWFTYDEFLKMKDSEISFKTNTTNVKARECFAQYLKKNGDFKKKFVNVEDCSWYYPPMKLNIKSTWYGINQM